MSPVQTFTDLPGWIVAAAAIIGPIAGALIVYGRQSDHLNALSKRITKMETEFDADSRVGFATSVGLTRHEAECGRRDDAITQRFDRLETMVLALSVKLDSFIGRPRLVEMRRDRDDRRED